MEYAKSKHKRSFESNVLNEDAPSDHHMGKLLTRKKRGRPKRVLSALDICDDHDSDDDDSINDDDLTEGHLAEPYDIQTH